MSDNVLAELTALADAALRADSDLDAQLERLCEERETATNSGSGSAAQLMANVLAERDRNLAVLQHEADERYALLEETTRQMLETEREAEARLALIDELTTEMEQLRAETDARDALIQSLSTQLEGIGTAAAERLGLLESNEAHYRDFRVELRGRLFDLLNLIDASAG